jgi:hypothetical protein
MSKYRFSAAIAALVFAAPLAAQIGVRASSSTSASSDDAIVVEGRKKELVQALRQLVQPSEHEQLARFEDKVCPMVIGMPRDWTARLTKIIRDNVIEVGGKLMPEGCKPNALAIFIDQPRQLVDALHKDAPFYFSMSPRQYDNFTAASGPVWSWHVTDMRSRDGVQLAQGQINGHDFAVVKNAAASRLYSNIREDMLVGFVVIDRQRTIGSSLRQLGDLATMHLLLDVRPNAGARNSGSILSLFEAGAVPPDRLSRFDKGALTGFYTQRENNRTATQQRENIVEAIRRGAGEEKDKK